mgnify:CR=1 FL=1
MLIIFALCKSIGNIKRMTASKEDNKSKFIPCFTMKSVFFQYKIITIAAKLNKIMLLRNEKILTLKILIYYFLNLIKFSNSSSSESENTPSCTNCETIL